MARADVVFFDGTLFRDDEMIATGTGTKTGRRMGHMPIDGRRRLACGARRALPRGASTSTSTTPIRSWSTARPNARRVERDGWEIAEDGMEIVL